VDCIFLQRLLLAAVAVLGLRWVLGSRALPIHQMTAAELFLAALLGLLVFFLLFADERYLLVVGVSAVLVTAALRHLLDRG
jgi:hypothetical protein